MYMKVNFFTHKSLTFLFNLYFVYRRLYFIEKGCTWGSLNVKWTLETHQLLSPPTVVNNKLILHVNKVLVYYTQCIS